MTVQSKPQTASRQAARPAKPPKPYDGFPLGPHNSGYWCKSIRGKLKFFGPWARTVNGKLEPLPYEESWKAALERFDAEKADLYAGRKPQPRSGDLTVGRVCNAFLTSKTLLLKSGELAPRTFGDYKRVTDMIVAFFGGNRKVEELTPADFEQLRARIAKTNGPVRLGGQVGQVRMVFKYAYDAGLIDSPLRFGPNFKKPSAKVLRKAKNGAEAKFFSAAEIRKLLAAAPAQLKAMILLGVNCGLGNSDCGNLPQKALDLDGGWLNYPRPKTGIERRCPLWKETIAALREALATRPTHKDKADAGLVFITQHGQRWAKDTQVNPISNEFGELCDDLGIKRRGVSFYSLRHVFQTIGNEARDPAAVSAIMGHSPSENDMSANYTEHGPSDERLKAVVAHVRGWLFKQGGQNHE